MKYKNIVFDFDGVLADTNEIRFNGFRELFKEYPLDEVDRLVYYCERNGGISRYVKIRYFFNTIRGEGIQEGEVQVLAQKFSDVVKPLVVEANAIGGSVEFLTEHADDFNFAVISGSDQKELREVCDERGIGRFFSEILGAPANKDQNFSILFEATKWSPEEVIFVGDSINDFDAARNAGVGFIGRQSGLEDWAKHEGVPYMSDISELFDLVSSSNCRTFPWSF